MDDRGKPASDAVGAETSGAQELSRVPVEDNTVDAARREKIARLKKSVEDGTYHVSSEQVARKVIEDMLQPKASKR